MSANEDDVEPSKSIFRKSVLSALSSGASGSFIAGVVYFMGTSNVKKTHQIVMGSFLTFGLGSLCFSLIQNMKSIQMMDERNQLEDMETKTS